MRDWPVFILLPCVLMFACGGGGRHAPSPSSSNRVADLSITFPDDQPDLALARPDLAEALPDLTASRLLGCGSIITCLNKCGHDANCQSGCPVIATPQAVTLFTSLLRCILGDKKAGLVGACSSFDGGICDPDRPGFDETVCSDCQNECQMPGGACFNELADCVLNCEQDSECRSDPLARCINHVCQLP